MTGMRCRFCPRVFKNAQAVKGHLRACPGYQRRAGRAEPAQPARAGSKAEPIAEAEPAEAEPADEPGQPAQSTSGAGSDTTDREYVEQQKEALADIRQIVESVRGVDDPKRLDEALDEIWDLSSKPEDEDEYESETPPRSIARVAGIGSSGPVPSGRSGGGGGFNPAAIARQDLEAEKTRLELRRVRAAHADLDEQETKQVKAQQNAAHQAERGREQARLEAAERRELEGAEAERKRKRRAIIQAAKEDGEFSWRLKDGVTPELIAQAKRAIESALSALPVEDLPQSEVRELAEAERARVCGPAVEAAERARAEAARAQSEKWRQVGDSIVQTMNQGRQIGQLLVNAERLAREALERTRRFRRLDAWGQTQKVRSVVAAVRTQLTALPADQLEAMTERSVRELIGQAIDEE